MDHSHITDPHITAWLLSLILFVIALRLNKKGNSKGFRIVHMILRVFYLLIIITGGMIIFSMAQVGVLYYVKAAAGLWVIALLEMILIRLAAKRKTKVLWYQFVIALLLVFYLGFDLPLGIEIF